MSQTRPPIFARAAHNRLHGAAYAGQEVCDSYFPSAASVESTLTSTGVRGLELSCDTSRSPVGNKLVATRQKSLAAQRVRSILKIKVTGTAHAITALKVRALPTEISDFTVGCRTARWPHDGRAPFPTATAARPNEASQLPLRNTFLTAKD